MEPMKNTKKTNELKVGAQKKFPNNGKMYINIIRGNIAECVWVGANGNNADAWFKLSDLELLKTDL